MSVSSVGHCSRKPVSTSTKATYCGWRMRAYTPSRASRPSRCARYSTGQAVDNNQNPPPINTKLAMLTGPKCGLARQPNHISSQCPASWMSQLPWGQFALRQTPRTYSLRGKLDIYENRAHIWITVVEVRMVLRRVDC